MHKGKPLVSIITATYNAEKFIESSILSVLNQTYSNIEYIIIDGKSTDGTLKILEKYSNQISTIISEPDLGIYDAWNKGLKIAQGDWIGFLGADDVYMPVAIDNYINYIQSINDKEIEFVSSKIQLVSGKKNLKIIGKAWNWGKFKYNMTVAHVGSLHSKEFFNKYGSYDLSYKIVGDYEMLLRAKGNLKAGFLDEITVKMQIGGISSRNINTIIETQNAINNLTDINYIKINYWMIKRYIHWILFNKYKINK